MRRLNLNEQACVASLLWIIGIVVTIYKTLTVKSLLQFFVGLLMFLALMVALGLLMAWWDSKT